MSKLDNGILTSIDEHGSRLNIIPAEVRGFFRRHRDWSQIVLLVLFLGLPWTHVNGYQTILLNITDREFSLFGILFRAHDAPLLFFVLVAFALGLAMVTAVWGRVWCGWACPQTVFIDAVYRRIEFWTEGDYIQRRRFRDSPLTWNSFRKKAIKWILFLIVSALIAHSFMAYFLGSANLLAMMGKSPNENFGYFSLTLAFTSAVLFNFAWFREQFCVIMCPYGRIQSLLIDQSSGAIVYDATRGEPRKGMITVPAQKSGDCVACNRCVQVCPTGIDIRNGLQMDCIACTACADACDEIMDKVHKPRGLISYRSLDGSKITFFKPRVLLYACGIILLLGGLSHSILTRSSMDATILRGGGMPYTLTKDNSGNETVLNHFKIHIQNQSAEAAEFKIIPPEAWTHGNIVLTVAQNPIRLNAGEFQEWHFFIQFPKKVLPESGQLKTEFNLSNISVGAESIKKEIILIGPKTR